ncbi:hypothetical protein A2973_00845 [Candidatus Gottesmanbacteria bacterium RIFCSPLOWO2_01_FULL_49_10]|uniref:ArnT-like N-terminal domain-containing protein n=1 Tax=Candidatus Gottesmanbacteria bacterium RIFCSPLOWO2_01_FULL_49_10 TaxID=1798396 RepID=A0A1F6AWR7_9BACT|nr:MAG: hypothetical protein A2973_00845 [Candidatus Gottesmanbacteria bacterium RIFCSPLOWO2_01_FULL_49_10]
MNIHTRYALIAIVLLAFFLRFYRVTQIPPALSWDEVSIGYNAYSILKTARDEHGKVLPVAAFAAYGDYKPPIPIYLTVPFVALLGLGELSVRLPSVLLGTLTVVMAFFLVRELRLVKLKHLPLLATLILAISPWHIQLSRAGFEANIAVFFMVLGVWSVLSVERNYRFLLGCWVPFVLAMYTFNSARYVAPLLALGLFVFVLRHAKIHKRELIAGIAIAVFLLLPIVPHIVSREARLRFEEVNIFTDLSVVTTSNERIALDRAAWWSKMFHNRRVGYARSYLIHFFDHFQPWFLFVRGDGNPKFSIQDVGQLYFVEGPLLVIGIFWLFFKYPRVAWLLVYWVVVSIIPAATARETPHALRIENSLPVWQIIAGAGILVLIYEKKKHIFGRLIIMGVVCLYVFQFGYYWHNYYTHYPVEFSRDWQFGYKEAVTYIKTTGDRYDTIVISESIGRPYMYVLFYERYDPDAFRKTVDGSFDAAGFYNVYGFGKYRFTRQGVGDYPGRVLYVLPADHVPKNAHIYQNIRLLNGESTLVMFDV